MLRPKKSFYKYLMSFEMRKEKMESEGGEEMTWFLCIHAEKKQNKT